MRGVTVKTAKTVALTLDADDWELYTSSPALHARASEAVAAINAAIQGAVNSGADRKAAAAAAHVAMRAHSGAGADDTEPRGVLADVLDEVYGHA